MHGLKVLMYKKSKKQLIGHSGCKVELIDKGNYFAVRKTSCSIDYNKRLKKQLDKQKEFRHPSIKVPAIFKEGYDRDLLYFEMEYIKGVTLSKKIEDLTTSQIIDKMSVFIPNILNCSAAYDPEAKKYFLKKINELNEKILKKNKTILKAFEYLENYRWDKIEKSQCHGDLTFENIIVSADGTFWFIDFLDSFYSSWMIDAAKLFQDFELQWSYRYLQSSKNREIRLFIAKETIIKYLLEIKKGEGTLLSIYYILLLNILRIIPYSSDNLLDYLCISLDKVLNIIDDISNKKIHIPEKVDTVPGYSSVLKVINKSLGDILNENTDNSMCR